MASATEKTKDVKGKIDRWAMVAAPAKIDGKIKMVALIIGDRDDGKFVTTSRVVATTECGNVVETENSIYTLGTFDPVWALKKFQIVNG